MPAADVALGDRHDEAQVGLDQLAAWPARRRAALRSSRRRSAKSSSSMRPAASGRPAASAACGAGLDALGQRDLLGRR